MGRQKIADMELVFVAGPFLKSDAWMNLGPFDGLSVFVNHNPADGPSGLRLRRKFGGNRLGIAARIPFGPVRPVAGRNDAEAEPLWLAWQRDDELTPYVGLVVMAVLRCF